MEYVEISAIRDAYSIDDVAERTLTVGELAEILEEFEDDVPVILSHDRGYTYGALHASRINLESTSDDEENEEEEEIEADDTFDESWNLDESCDKFENEEEETSWDSESEFLDEECLHCGNDDDDEDMECDDDFGKHENSRDVDEVYSFKGLNDSFGGKTLAESLRPRAPKRKRK